MFQRMHEKLIAWREGYAFCFALYRVTIGFPSHERFGLVSQIRRAAFSIPANIAEGNARRSFKEKMHFIDIASASTEEIHVALMLSKDMSYITKEQFETLNGHLRRVSYLLMKLHASHKNSFASPASSAFSES